LLLTDGFSNGIRPLGPANALRKLGVNIFSIGIGNSVSVAELNAIASDPKEDYVVRLPSFDQLASFAERISSLICRD
jgi:collagen type VI alpha